MAFILPGVIVVFSAVGGSGFVAGVIEAVATEGTEDRPAVFVATTVNVYA